MHVGGHASVQLAVLLVLQPYAMQLLTTLMLGPGAVLTSQPGFET